jgi:hypothetical protein
MIKWISIRPFENLSRNLKGKYGRESYGGAKMIKNEN